MQGPLADLDWTNPVRAATGAFRTYARILLDEGELYTLDRAASAPVEDDDH